jgi:hypothetical protein
MARGRGLRGDLDGARLRLDDPTEEPTEASGSSDNVSGPF